MSNNDSTFLAFWFIIMGGAIFFAIAGPTLLNMDIDVGACLIAVGILGIITLLALLTPSKKNPFINVQDTEETPREMPKDDLLDFNK